MRKAMTLLLVLSLLNLAVLPIFAEDAARSASPIEGLQQLEIALYGRTESGAIIPRLDRVEKDLYGDVQDGVVLTRLQKLSNVISASDLNATSLKLKLNAAEWMIYQKTSSTTSLLKRIDQVELGLYGAVQQGPLAIRIDDLVRLVWPDGKVTTQEIKVTPGQLVKVELLSGVSSAKSQTGDSVRYRVVDDVVINNVVVIPAGTEGQGRVSQVSAAGRLGRDAQLSLDFRSVPAIDGTSVRLVVQEKATEKNMSMEIAAGASMAGVILLGPIGLAGGYFVKGKDIEIPVSTTFFVEVMEEIKVTGLSLIPQI